MAFMARNVAIPMGIGDWEVVIADRDGVRAVTPMVDAETKSRKSVVDPRFAALGGGHYAPHELKVINLIHFVCWGFTGCPPPREYKRHTNIEAWWVAQPARSKQQHEIDLQGYIEQWGNGSDGHHIIEWATPRLHEESNDGYRTEPQGRLSQRNTPNHIAFK